MQFERKCSSATFYTLRKCILHGEKEGRWPETVSRTSLNQFASQRELGLGLSSRALPSTPLKWITLQSYRQVPALAFTSHFMVL